MMFALVRISRQTNSSSPQKQVPTKHSLLPVGAMDCFTCQQ
jgi:hypothetical protein